MTAHQTAIGSIVPIWAGASGGGGGGSSCVTVASFVNADLAAGVYTFAHALGGQYVVIQIYDNNSQVVAPDDITAGGVGTASVDLSSFGTLVGTWRAVAVGACP